MNSNFIKKDIEMVNKHKDAQHDYDINYEGNAH